MEDWGSQLDLDGKGGTHWYRGLGHVSLFTDGLGYPLCQRHRAALKHNN